MKRFVFVLVAATVCLVSAGCGKQYGGGALGGWTQADGVTQDCYVLQLGVRDSATPGPLFAILWTARVVGGIQRNNRNQLVTIHGFRIEVPFDRKAIYALQPDYTVTEIALSPEETDRVLNIIAAGQSPASDAAWQTKIALQLKVVEYEE